MGERVLLIRRVLRASPQAVFDAWLDASLMAQWFFAGECSRAVVRNDPVVGGSYRVDMVTPGGTTYTQQGVYREIVPPTRIAFTWSNDLVQDSLVVLEFRSKGEDTELVLTHTLPDRDEVAEKHKIGWESCLARLEELLRGAAPRG